MFQRLSTWGVFDELGGDGGDCQKQRWENIWCNESGAFIKDVLECQLDVQKETN